MQPLAIILVYGVRVLAVVTLVGLVARSRVNRCRSLVALLVAVVAFGTLMSFFPSRFYTRSFWMIKEAVYCSLRIAVGIEVAYAVVRAFPGAAATARRSALAILSMTLSGVMLAPGELSKNVFAWEPRLLAGTIWLFAMTALITVWYQLPIHLWHRAILMGFTAYLSVVHVLFGLLPSRGWLGGVDAVASLALYGWLAFSAWRPPELVRGIEPELLRVLRLEEA